MYYPTPATEKPLGMAERHDPDAPRDDAIPAPTDPAAILAAIGLSSRAVREIAGEPAAMRTGW